MPTDINRLKLDVNEPDLLKRRSYIANLKHGSHFTCNATDLVPMDGAWPVLPGDTWKLRQTMFIRMTNPPKTPTMDQLVVDYYYFYTPYRVLDTGFDKFITGDKGTDWTSYPATVDTAAYVIVKAGDSGAQSYDISSSLYQYLHMLPGVVKTNATSANDTIAYLQAYPLTNYYSIWNEYFRVEAFQSPVATYDAQIGRLAGTVSLKSVVAAKSGYRSTYGVGLTNPPSLFNGVLCETARLGDYFSTALPAPMKGGETGILNNITLSETVFNWQNDSSITDGTAIVTSDGDSDYPNTSIAAGTYGLGSISTTVNPLLSNTITSLKQAFALDYIKTLDARYGQRITEFSKAHFNVVVPDYRVPRPEFLGKRRFYFNINQVIQSSETNTTPQGNAGAWGQTLDKNQFIFSKSFTEYGIIQGVMTIRVLNHSYAQGIDAQYNKFRRFDFYIPALANISDTPVYKDYIYLHTLSTETSLSTYLDKISSSTFGYQEAWAEYKYMPNRVAGMLDPSINQSLAIWTYTDYYASAPTLNSRWLVEPISNIDNTLMVTSELAPQFIVDCFFDIDAYRCMPVHSEIGVIKGW